MSVVLTSYNYATFLPAALEALAAQTRPPDELIVVDDHSSDDSVAVITSFLGRFADGRLAQNKSNLGTIANLNRGLELARGTVVFFAAADDIAYPTLLERGMGLFEAHPNAALFSARSDIIDVRGERESTLATATPLRQPGFLGPDAVARQLMHDDNWLTGNTTLYRRDALLNVGGFAAELGSFCDGYVSRLLALRHGACFSPEVLGAWRRHAGGYAWSQTADWERTQALVAAVRHRIETDGVFPPGYAHRWAQRYLFGARRFALARKSEAARSRGTFALGWARAREVAASLALFAAYRPWDFATVARRRLAAWRRPPADPT
ncbi:MAG TPA: glycosyltransferase family 2 protein [Stellaceae bacterium]|nr:glycosyltransferase family 2 protein [Stellaceae bacterium]